MKNVLRRLRLLLAAPVAAAWLLASSGAGTGAAQVGPEVAHRLQQTGGDIIVGVDGQPVTSTGGLFASIENNRRPGDTATLTVLRNGQRQQVIVQLTQHPSEVCPIQAS